MVPKIYIGCSGWFYKDWANAFYPKGLPPKERLSYYARFFNTVEINNTFYKFPTESALQSWISQTAKEFKCSLKTSRYITHVKRFKNVKESLSRLYGLSDILGEKMGCFLFQFPKNMSFSFGSLENLITQLGNTYPNIVEFRHQGWWNPHVIYTFKAANIEFCTVSGFSLPEDLIINKRAYLRFHGDPAYSSLYSNQALSEWAQRIKSNSLDEVWIYFNNDQNAYAVQNALELKKLLERKSEV